MKDTKCIIRRHQLTLVTPLRNSQTVARVRNYWKQEKLKSLIFCLICFPKHFASTSSRQNQQGSKLKQRFCMEDMTSHWVKANTRIPALIIFVLTYDTANRHTISDPESSSSYLFSLTDISVESDQHIYQLYRTLAFYRFVNLYIVTCQLRLLTSVCGQCRQRITTTTNSKINGPSYINQRFWIKKTLVRNVKSYIEWIWQ